MSRFWVALAALVVLLLFLVVFVAQNTERVSVSFLGLGVAHRRWPWPCSSRSSSVWRSP